MNERRNLLQESLAAIERLQAKLAASDRAKHVPIAVVGVGCRYPGGIDSLDALWRVVRDGVDAVSEIPSDRWNVDEYYDPDPAAPGRMVTRRGGFLQDIDKFDPLFFGIAPREAATLDPQQRLLLETAWEALEDAAIAPDTLSGTATGVFVGITTSDYGQITRAGGVEQMDVYSATGSALNAAAGRISFTLGLQGPCASVDTACSSSLVAVHLACQSLRAGDSNLALAGGVNVVLSPDAMVLFSKWGMMAPDGRCKTFDAAADGFVRSEGCAMIVLKRLPDALAAGDPILAVIRGTAVNSDGRSSGLTVPNGPAQQAVIRTALADAQVAPGEVDYVEAHGTGTQLGDPIEIEALGRVMREGRSAEHPLYVGSIKTNIGHCEAASGLAGLLKTVAAMRHGQIPPHLHFKTPNPGIPWDSMPLRVPTSAIDWPRGSRARFAGVSSFGFSGTNAHVVLAEAPAREAGEVQGSGPAFDPADVMSHVVPISAQSDAALRELAGRYARFLEQTPQVALRDFATTLQAGRARLNHRAALVARSVEELTGQLREFSEHRVSADISHGALRPGEQPRIAFLFTGQGVQYPGMGRRLYESEPVFRQVLDRAAAILAPLLPRPLIEVLYPRDDAESPIGQTMYTQPALFALEYALAELWRSWGVVPAIVAGHSVGEYTAACVAGVFSFEDGLQLVAARAQLMQALPPGGAMAAIFAREEVVAGRIAPMGDRVAIAAVNGPEETVISGDAEAIAALLAQFAADGANGKPLDVSHAFHSPLLEPMLEPFERRARSITFGVPRIPLVSNLMGRTFRSDEKPDGRYWRQHARHAVRFADCVKALHGAGATVLLEVGPHPTLLALAARAAPAAKWSICASLRRGRDDRTEILRALGILFASGAPVRWDATAEVRSARRLSVPTYPFQRERHWVPRNQPVQRLRASAGHPLLGERQRLPGANLQFLSEIALEQLPCLADHRVLGKILMPGAAFLEIGLAAARQVGASRLLGLSIEAPLELHASDPVLVHTEVAPLARGEWSLVIRSASPVLAAGEDWQVHARGKLAIGAISDGIEPFDVKETAGADAAVTDFYSALQEAGLDYGPIFRALRSIAVEGSEATGKLEVPAGEAPPSSRWIVHPALLDGAFQLLGALLQKSRRQAGGNVYLPIGVDEMQVEGAVGPVARAVIRLRGPSVPSETLAADLQLLDDRGRALARISGLHLRAATPVALARALGASVGEPCRYELEWTPVAAQAGNSVSRPSCCIVLGASGGLADALCAEIRHAGGTAHHVQDAADGASLGSLLAEYVGKAEDGWVIDCSPLDPSTPSEPPVAARRAYARSLRIMQALSATNSPLGYCIVTRGAQAIAPGDDVDLAQATLLGLARSAASERGSARSVRLDLDPQVPPDVGQLLVILLGTATSEPELGIRAGVVLMPRLRDLKSVAAKAATPDGSRCVLRVAQRGSLDNLEIVKESRRTPGPGEVEIVVQASGLNFRDVMNALGMYPGDPGPLGSECAGSVAALGPGVTGLAVGDEVVAFAVDSFASHVTVDAALVLRRPTALASCDAVTLPNAYLTAAYSLHSVANMKPGQRILIHAAAGGVGLAALRLARRAGVEVIGTASTPEKRAFLLAEGALAAFDSRRTTFAREVMQVTSGAGVDIVLNSLSGELIDASLRVLSAGGCFVEIGKSGIWTLEEVASRYPAVRYEIVDLGLAIQRDLSGIRREFESVLALVAAGDLAPLPLRVFSLDDAIAAFRHMATARHIGKVVLVPGRLGERSPLRIREDATYLVTGGLGGLGLAVASWLAQSGARHIVLVGRRGALPEHRQLLQRIEAHGARVESVACDVGDASDVRRLSREVLAELPPLRGIVHAAGVLGDAPLATQSEQGFDAVARPKVDGAWNLHRLVGRRSLDFFALFSSSSALLGAPGQANYAAGSAFLDALARDRPALGQVCTSIGWGAWSETGMASRLSEETRARWSRLGVNMIETRAAMAALEEVLSLERPAVAVIALDVARYVHNATRAVRALFGEAGEAGTTSLASPARPVGATSSIDLRDAPAEKRDAILRTYSRQVAARILGFAAESLDADMPLSALGFDSLMAVQLRNAISQDLSIDVPLASILKGLTVNDLASQIAMRLGGPASSDVSDTTGDLPPLSASRLPQLPLSFAQERLWFFDQLEPGSAAYNIPLAIRLCGSLDRAALDTAVTLLVSRHEVLRSRFSATAEQPTQIVELATQWIVPCVDLRGVPAAQRAQTAAQQLRQASAGAFDLQSGPMLRTLLIQLEDDLHLLVVTFHHIVVDGWSMLVFLRELGEFYRAALAGTPADLPELAIQYADYSIWQRSWMTGPVLEKELAYWRTALAGAPMTLDLPLDRPRPKTKSYTAAVSRREIQPEIVARLDSIGNSIGATPFMTLLAAFAVLLGRQSGQQDILIGTPISGRPRQELEGLIGIFVNTLAIRARLDERATFLDLLAQVRETALGAYAHQYLPFDRLVEELQPVRDLSRTPVFQVLFNMLNLGEAPTASWSSVVAEPISDPTQLELHAQFDLTMYARTDAGRLALTVVYNADLFDEARVEDMLDQYQSVLANVATQPEVALGDLSLVTDAARAQLPDPALPISRKATTTFVARFYAVASRQPSHPAVADSTTSLTYAELDAMSNQLARLLRESGISRSDVVAILAERNAGLAWAILGIAKAGAAFLVLDSSYPEANLAARIDIAAPTAWIDLCSTAISNVLEGALERNKVHVRLGWSAARGPEAIAWRRCDSRAPEVQVNEDDLAYLVFTSGTTGAPKAIASTHAPLSHFFEWHQAAWQLTSSDRFSVLSGLSHDPLLRDVLGALWVGGTSVIPRSDRMGSPGYLAEWLLRERISVVHLTPAMADLVSGEGTSTGTTWPDLRRVFFGGDALLASTVNALRMQSPHATFVNFYGSSETPQAMGFYRIPDIAGSGGVERIPVGSGIPDVQLLVLTHGGGLAGIGELGEICVRTPYLALGYRGDQALTAARFATNPATGEPRDRIYRTGDLGRYGTDGAVHFQGRRDSQVKIRGFRVELGEVTSALRSHPGVAEATTIFAGASGDDGRIVAYYVARAAGGEPSAEELRIFLGGVLPEYMIPSSIVELNAMPLTPNGKIDRALLPAPSRKASRAPTAPRSDLESTIASVWREVLGESEIGVEDNFFELGGHSLKATRVISRLRAKVNVDVPLRMLFEAPTVSSLAKRIEEISIGREGGAGSEREELVL